MRDLIRRLLRRSLAAAGLARRAEVERERQAAAKVRARAEQAATASASKLTTLQEKYGAARDRLAAERAESSFTRGLMRDYRGRLEDADARLARGAADQELLSVFRGFDERLAAQLARGAAQAQRAGVSAAAAARGARHASQSAEYAATSARWQAGATPPVPQPAIPFAELALIRQYAAGGIMLDIGAGTGERSIPHVLLGDFALAYAAEPDPDAFFCLVANTLHHRLDGRVLPDRAAIGGSDDGATTTIDGWIQRLGIPADEITFVRVSAAAVAARALGGAASLLQRRHIVWQIELPPGHAARDLAPLIAAHFTHVRDLADPGHPLGQPAGDAAGVLQARVRGGRATLLLFSVE